MVHIIKKELKSNICLNKCLKSVRINYCIQFLPINDWLTEIITFLEDIHLSKPLNHASSLEALSKLMDLKLGLFCF